MTAAELIAQLQTYPPETVVYTENRCDDGGHEVELFPVHSDEGELQHLWIQPLGTSVIGEIYGENVE